MTPLAARAKKAAARANDDATWIAALGFTARKESWVATSAGRFYKLFRASDDPARDWLDAACGASAAREYANLRLLHRAAAEILEPLRLDRACVIYPELSGPDLRMALLRSRDGDASTTGLHAAMRLLARVHTTREDVSRYPFKTYAASTYRPPDPDVMRRIAKCPRQLCMEGFEVRNFRYDRQRRAWCFFDPQAVSLGVAENDVARFIVSLLMVTWGAGGALRIWTAFDAAALLATYQRAAARTLDPALLAYFVHESIAMRRHFAERALAGLRGARRLVGRPYLVTYFRQLEVWARKHEF